MRNQKKSFVWTIVLSLVFVVVLFINISWFISGPRLRYDEKQSQIYQRIEETIQQKTEVYRHVFQHIVYVTQDEENLYWFNEEGELVEKLEVTKLQNEEVQKIVSEMGIEGAQIRIGYGNKAPVYEIENENVYVLLDFNTLEVIHYRRSE